MRTRSLVSLHEHLQREWQIGSAVTVVRTGSRSFLVNDRPKAKESFIFGRGFTNSESNRQVTAQVADDPYLYDQVRDRLWRTRLFVVLAIVFCVFVLGIPAFNLASGWFLMNASSENEHNVKISASTSKQKLRHPSVDPCSVNLAHLRPLEANGVTKGLLLERDIVVGGERQQLVEYTCATEVREYQIRFSRLDGVWKAKSATPVGSRS